MSGIEEPPDGDDPTAPPGPGVHDKPLPRQRWAHREVERLDAEAFVVDAELITAGRKRGRTTDDLVAMQLGDDLALPLVDPPATPAAVPGPGPDPVPAAGAGAATEARLLQAQAPESVRPGQRFAVSAQLLCTAAGGHAGALLRPVDVPAQGRRVAIDLHAAGGLTVLTDATASVTLLPGQDADPVRFELEARAAGAASVTLRAYADGVVFLGQLRLEIPVSDAVPGAHQTAVSAALPLTPPVDRGATLEVDIDPSRMTLRFRLRGPGAIGIQPPEEVALSSGVDSVASGLQNMLDKIAKGAYGTDARPVDAMLRNYGADLWSRFLPSAVKDSLLRHLAALDELVVIGADDPLPWELLFPVVPGRTHGFLGDQLLIRRWAYGAAAPGLNLGRGDVRYVLPSSAPPAAFAEVDRLKAILGAGETISTLDGLLDAIDHAGFGILHFAAHNVGAGSDPASAYVKLDKPFLQAMLGTDRPGLFQDAAPLVFMNACNSGAASPLWVGSTGWAGRFLSAGAGAFVGSLWQVRDKPAKDFAECFYDKLQAGEALGAAFRAARQAVFRPGDPTRLGYILFGHAAATLARPTESTP